MWGAHDSAELLVVSVGGRLAFSGTVARAPATLALENLIVGSVLQASSAHVLAHVPCALGLVVWAIVHDGGTLDACDDHNRANTFDERRREQLD